jgi:hypothetical protein
MRKKHPKGKEYTIFTNLELKLMGIIVNLYYTQNQLDFFKQKIASNYVDQSNLYRLSVKYNKPELTKIILQSGKFDINDGELYIDISAAIMFDNEERLIHHIQNGYIPTERDLKGILEIYEEVGVESRNKELYQYFNNLHKNKSNGK